MAEEYGRPSSPSLLPLSLPSTTNTHTPPLSLLPLPVHTLLYHTHTHLSPPLPPLLSSLPPRRAVLPVPGVVQIVQRAEFGGAIVAMQAYWPCHLGIDNLDVARTIGRLLDEDCLVKPLPLVMDGDLVALVQYMIRTRGRETVRLEDQLGNAEAEAAADLGRRHQSEVLIDAGRRLLKARSHWYPIMLLLQRFMIAVARVVVNHNGRRGTAPDPLVWDQGGPKKARKLDIRVNVDLASLTGPVGFLGGPWMQVHGGGTTGADIAALQCWHPDQVYCFSWYFALAGGCC